MILAYSYRYFASDPPLVLDRILQWYRYSIGKAKELGYEVHMFTDKPDWFEVDRTIVCNPDFGSLFWDNFKMIAIGTFHQDYLCIDGDVLLRRKLDIPDADVIYDADEPGEYKRAYKELVRELTELGIKDVIPEWNPNGLTPLCCGLLRIPNKDLRYLYYNRWKKFHKFIENKSINTKWSDLTGVAAEYLLACLVDYYSLNKQPLSTELGVQNDSYRHFCGELKWDKSLVDFSSSTTLF